MKNPWLPVAAAALPVLLCVPGPETFRDAPQEPRITTQISLDGSTLLDERTPAPTAVAGTLGSFGTDPSMDPSLLVNGCEAKNMFAINDPELFAAIYNKPESLACIRKSFPGLLGLKTFNRTVAALGAFTKREADAITGSYNGLMVMVRQELKATLAQVSWDKSVYDIASPKPLALLRVVDPDRDLNPQTFDRVLAEVRTNQSRPGEDDSVVLVETREDSGVFEAAITLTPLKSRVVNVRFVGPKDKLRAIYIDKTLPAPYGPKDELAVTAESPVLGATGASEGP